MSHSMADNLYKKSNAGLPSYFSSLSFANENSTDQIYVMPFNKNVNTAKKMFFKD